MRLIDADLLKITSVGICDAYGNDYGCTDVVLAEDLKKAPTIDAELVRHGKWIDVIGGYLYECSKCKAQTNSNQFKSNLKYCPNCGAKMDLND